MTSKTSSRFSEVDSALIRLAPSTKTVQCLAGDTVLAALEREGFALPNNCRAGACGECKTKLLAGEVDQGTVLDMALTTEERAEGYRLMCMAKPVTEVVEIEFGSLEAKPKLFPPRDRVLCVVTDAVQRTSTIREVRIRPVGEPLRFWPGQYLLVGDSQAGVSPRPYSIANAPRPDGEMSLLVALVPDGKTSGWLHAGLQVGDRITVGGPYGTFIGDPGTSTPVLCLAAGSGLAPILALTDAALRRGFDKPVTVLFSARSEADVFDQGLTSWWAAKHRRFTFLTTFTGLPAGAEASGSLVGRIPDVLPGLMPDLADHAVYIAGSPEFVDACSEAALGLGAEQGRLHVERYVAALTA